MRDTELDDAIASFPILHWAERHFEFEDTGNLNIYANCPICGGKKSLGIEREKKIFHCFKCDPNEGGCGGTTWNGKVGLVRAVMLFENLRFPDAKRLIFSLAGFPEPKWTPRERPKEILPKSLIPLNSSVICEPARNELTRRHCPHLVSISYITDIPRYRGRIIIPTRFLDEDTGYEAKAYTGRTPKALYPDWFDSGTNVYTTLNWDYDLDFAVVTESILDAETIGWNGIGLYGGFKEFQLPRFLDLKAKGIKRLIWMLDEDAVLKQMKAVQYYFFPHFENYFVKMEGDPNKLGPEKCLHLVSSATPVESELDFLKFF